MMLFADLGPRTKFAGNVIHWSGIGVVAASGVRCSLHHTTCPHFIHQAQVDKVEGL